MKSLWEKESFEYQNVEIPKEIIDNQCKILHQLTNGEINAKLLEYQGSIHSYVKRGISSSIAMGLNQDVKVNIQDELGEVNKEIFKFEFFITSTSTPNYKYRVFFIGYGINFYPVELVLDETIATELNSSTNINCDTQESFEEVLRLILNSKKVEKVISALLTIVKKQQEDLLSNQ